MTRWSDGLTRRRVLPAVAAGAFLAGCLVYWLVTKSTYFAMLNGWGVVPVDFPFVDTHSVLSARACSALGIDPFITNPCDVLGRQFEYAPLFLLGAGTHELSVNVPPGFALNIAFIFSLFCLPVPRKLSDCGVMTLAVLSSVTAFAAERGNFELLLFAAFAVAGRLAVRRGTVSRLLTYGLVLAAAFAKFFAAALMALTLRERPRLFFAINAVAAGLIALFFINYRADLLVAYGNFPKLDYFGDTFGAVMLPYGLATFIPGFPAALMLAGLTLAAFAAAAVLARQPALNRAYAELPEPNACFSPSGACS